MSEILNKEDIIEIYKDASMRCRDTLAEKLEEKIIEITGIRPFIDGDTYVFNRFHMSLFIKILEKLEEKQ
jgi:hypothetical protein